MSRSNDPGHFFQTETALATEQRRAAKASNTRGDPIKVTSKILAVVADPLDPGQIYVAESGGLVRRVVLESGNITHKYTGHQVPVTCLALNSTGSILYAGSWDKTITSWHTETRQLLHTFTGHTDFIKSLLFINTSSGGILLSGSSDASIIVWNATTGKRLATLKGHSRAVGTMALDPVASTPETAIVYSAGSERDIMQWSIPLEDPSKAQEASESILEHDTSVYKVTFGGEDYDMWTASADFTARRIDVRTEGKKTGTRTDTILKHPDYVNDVLVEPRGRYAITACRDEGVRLWDIATGNLYHNFDGHANEVVGLTVLGNDTLVSVSIDCTIRRWPLKPADLRAAIEAEMAAKAASEENLPSKKKETTLTEEEERELAELMEDSE